MVVRHRVLSWLCAGMFVVFCSHGCFWWCLLILAAGTMTITGSNFVTSLTSVTVAGVAASISSLSTTQVIFAVPAVCHLDRPLFDSYYICPSILAFCFSLFLLLLLIIFWTVSNCRDKVLVCLCKWWSPVPRRSVPIPAIRLRLRR